MQAKKGQAAAEYLVTYGWALLVLAVVIVVILSTGVFNPSYFVSEECVLQPDIPCTGHQFYFSEGKSILDVRVENRLGYDMLLEKTSVTTNDVGVAGEGVWEGRTIGPTRLAQGANTTIRFEFTGERQPSQDSISKMKLSLQYYSCAREVNPECSPSGNPHTITGRVTARLLKQ